MCFAPVACVTGAISFFTLFFLFFVCVFFRRAKASAKRAGSARHARRGKASMLSTYEQQTYFRSSLLSPRSDDRKYVCCSQATLAFARLKNAKKNNACCAGYHSWAGVKVGIYEKKKNSQRQQAKALSVKNGMKRLCGLANSCVC